MRKYICYLVAVVCALVVSCGVDDSLYTVYLPYYENSFKTLDDAVLKSVGYKDVVSNILTRQVTANGSFEVLGSDVVRYGHCWSTNSGNVAINSDSSNCTMFKISSLNAEKKFSSLCKNLRPETVYYLRSFVVTNNGTVGYNPNIIKFTTDVPHDEWFDSGMQLFTSARGDGVCATIFDGTDTLVFYGLGKTKGVAYNDFYCFNKSTGQITTITNFKGGKRVGSTAFALDYTLKDGESIKKIYVGLGFDEDKNQICNDFYVYDVNLGRWEQLPITLGEKYQGNTYSFLGRRNSISFVVDSIAYICMGEVDGSPDASTGDCYAFYPQSQSFEPIGDFPEPRTGASVMQVGSDVYVVGGYDNNNNYPISVYKLTINIDPAKTVWKKVDCNFPGQGRAFGVSFSVGDCAYYGTGMIQDVPNAKEDATESFSDFYRFDCANMEWTQCLDYQTNYDSDNIGKPTYKAFGFAVGDRGYVGGGCQNGSYASNFWIYRP